MPEFDDKDCKAVVINCVNDAIVGGAKPKILTLSLKTLDPCRAGFGPQTLDLVAESPPVGAG
jgi:hypothetical protein